MSRIAVLHLIDSLDMGGAERVAVNYVNHLPRSEYIPFLYATRREGALSGLVASDVQRIDIKRQGRFDLIAINRVRDFIRSQQIRILHAHGPALVFAVIASLVNPAPVVIWHVHFGGYVEHRKWAWIYWLAARRLHGVIAVNQPLARWAQSQLGISQERVWYIPNFVSLPAINEVLPGLPGQAGARIVCVANLRPEKGHPYLLQAMKLVVAQVPQAQLLLVGKANDPGYAVQIQTDIDRLGLAQNVTLLGQRQDIAAILNACDIGVLSSLVEGLPLALLEYGAAGLPVVSPWIGECADVLDNGRSGILVPPADPPALAGALINLLKSPDIRNQLGNNLKSRIDKHYSMQFAIEQTTRLYRQVLSS